MKSILLVDDDKEEHFVFCRALNSIRVSTHCKALSSAKEALHHLTRIPYYHLIFLDVHMPGMNGLSCLKEFKANDRLKHIPVVIFTNRISTDDVDECLRLGASLILHKPNTLFELMNELEAILQRFSGLQLPGEYFGPLSAGSASSAAELDHSA